MQGEIFMESPFFVWFGRVGDDKVAAAILTHPFALHLLFWPFRRYYSSGHFTEIDEMI